MATRLRILGATLGAVALAAPGRAQDGGPRAIAGRVMDAAGEPAAGVEVFLRWRAHPELPGLIGHSLPAAGGGAAVGHGELLQRSDEKGRFRFDPPHRGPFLLIAHGEDRAASSPRVFPVMHGSFHTLRLEPSFFMAGKVVAADGSPVKGAAVRLAPTSMQWERAGHYNVPERRSEAVSDAKGRFRLLYEHGYLRSPRWEILTAPLAVDDVRSSSAVFDPLRPVRSTRDLTLVLGGGPAMSGVVTDRRGEPVAGARVFDPELPGATATTGRDGHWLVPASSGQLLIRSEGLAPVPLNGPYGTTNNALLMPGHELRAQLLGPEGPLANARVLWVSYRFEDASPEWTGTTDGEGRIVVGGLPRAQPLLGFVEVDGRFRRFFAELIRGDREREVAVPRVAVMRGQVLSRTRQPLPGVRVAVWPVHDAFVIPPYITYTDHGGRFELDVPAEEHTIALDAGKHGATSRVVAVADLAKEQALKLPDTPGVSGRVLDAEGRPAPGAWVTISRAVALDRTYAPAPRLTMQAFCTLADGDGQFAFTGLPAGATWNAVGALMRDDVKYNTMAVVRTGGTVELRVGVEQQ